MTGAPVSAPWIRDAWAYEARRRLREIRRGRLPVGEVGTVAMAATEGTETRTAPVWAGWRDEP